MSENPPPDPLARLGAEIDEARRERLPEEARRGGPPPGTLAFGYRVAIELVAGLCVGLALGWGCDRLFGTRPWGLIIGFFLGAAAGMLNVFREAKGMGLGGNAPPPGDAGGPRRG